MRKFILSLSVAAVAAGALCSCGGNKSNATAEEKAFADTLSTTLGEYAAANQMQMLERMKANMTPEEFAKFNKADFLAGLKVVMTADTSKSAYLSGIQTGLQLMQPVIGISQNFGFPVDPKLVYESFKKVYEKDSLASIDDYYAAYQEAFQKMQAKATEMEEKRIVESDEYKQNTAAGEAYVANALKEGYTKSASGIVYKIENPGTGDKVKKNDKVSILYKGKKTDGSVFDETNDKPYTASAAGFISGFTEALTLVGKGGKVTVVIPGDQAYGARGAGEQIGPNETLIFDIEVTDVIPASAE